MSTCRKGTVYLVGAGPGDPDLITVKGRSAIRSADVIVHDRLVNPVLLAAAPLDAEIIDVGKQAKRHAVPQDDINRILVDKALEGHVVVRLKGGDPFVFGRGGEECLALAGYGIPYEIVPGISSAVAVPAYAGIPVTHRYLSSMVTIVTGHGCSGNEEPIDWRSIPAGGTLVVLMGVSRLAHIADELVAGGWDAETPVSIIQDGTTAVQKTVSGTLADIAGRAAGVRPPATIVVGAVASLGSHLAWFHPDTVDQSNADRDPIPSSHALPHFAAHSTEKYARHGLD